MKVPIDQIDVDEDFNCRGAIPPSTVLDLLRSIQSQGQLTPIVVQTMGADRQKETGKKYLLLAGYRRHMAHVVGKIPEIDATVRDDLDSKGGKLLNLLENVARKNLNILQEAKAIESLVRDGAKREEVADAVGMSKGWAQIRMMVLEFPEEVQELAGEGKITQTEIRDLYSYKTAGYTHSQLLDAAAEVVDSRIKGKKPDIKSKARLATKPYKRQEADLNRLQDHIREAIGNNLATRVVAWATATISDEDIYSDIEAEVAKHNKLIKIRDSVDFVEIVTLLGDIGITTDTEPRFYSPPTEPLHKVQGVYT